MKLKDKLKRARTDEDKILLAEQVKAQDARKESRQLQERRQRVLNSLGPEGATIRRIVGTIMCQTPDVQQQIKDTLAALEAVE